MPSQELLDQIGISEQEYNRRPANAKVRMERDRRNRAWLAENPKEIENYKGQNILVSYERGIVDSYPTKGHPGDEVPVFGFIDWLRKKDEKTMDECTLVSILPNGKLLP